MPERIDLIHDFLNTNGWGDADRKILAADASFRRYDRLTRGNETMVFMDAPPPMEDVRPFVKVACHLEKLGYSAPHLYAVDEENGFLLLEDFGDATYTRLLKKGENEHDLYALATDLLIDLHRQEEKAAVPENLPPYDGDALMREAMLFPDWFMPAAFGVPTDKETSDEYALLWEDVFPLARNVPQTIVLRDYHVDNLMRLEDRAGIRACGLLDFQDALHGPVTYDIMSLLEDARRDIAPDLFHMMRERYMTGTEIPDRETFLASWAVLAAQRHAKVLGIFVRLCVRDKKNVYLRHLPRLWRLMERALEHPCLGKLKVWFDKHIPPEKRTIPPCLLQK
ncbi:MAG: aminoglycoside phosphotransferase family protein [Alphaproteobacteria bacterium]|jgi:aminoglycoside/choline kinase family phosphotransferase